MLIFQEIFLSIYRLGEFWSLSSDNLSYVQWNGFWIGYCYDMLNSIQLYN